MYHLELQHFSVQYPHFLDWKKEDTDQSQVNSYFQHSIHFSKGLIGLWMGLKGRGSNSLRKILGNSKDSGSKSSSSFRTSVFNVRRIKSEHHKHLKKEKITTSEVRLWRQYLMNHVNQAAITSEAFKEDAPFV